MVRTPRNVRQQGALRAFVKAGGTLRQGRGGHQAVKMPNGHIVSLPTGVIKVGLLQSEVKKAGLSMEEFLELL